MKVRGRAGRGAGRHYSRQGVARAVRGCNRQAQGRACSRPAAG